MTITTKNTLAEIAAGDFRTAAVFNKYGLDFCCGGKKTIEEACSKKGLDSEAIVDELLKAITNDSDHLHFNDWSADFLADYIVNNHHAYTKRIIPLILKHSEKAARVHGKTHPELIEIYDIFSNVAEEMNAHMAKEERILFPFIKKLASGANDDFTPPFGSVTNPISVMVHEHNDTGDAMAKINELSSNYNTPEDLCETCRILYRELNDFEQDLHIHVHLENNILFPMAIKLEGKSSSNEPIVESCQVKSCDLF